MMRKLFALALIALGLAFVMAGCQKEGCTDSKASNYDPDAKKDNGTCVYTTPVVPTKEIVLDWHWLSFNDDMASKISKDTIKKYADMEDVKFVFLNILNEDRGEISSTMSTAGFRYARDTLQTRFDISEKVRGSGIIYVEKNAGAQVPDDVTYGDGMHVSDSTWYAEKGYTIKRYDPSSGK